MASDVKKDQIGIPSALLGPGAASSKTADAIAAIEASMTGPTTQAQPQAPVPAAAPVAPAAIPAAAVAPPTGPETRTPPPDAGVVVGTPAEPEELEGAPDTTIPAAAVTPPAATESALPTAEIAPSTAADTSPEYVQSVYATVAQKHGFATTSTTRTVEENKRVGGVANSQHLESNGTARDFSVKGKTPAQIAQFAGELRALGYDVITDNHGTAPHVHVELANGSARKADPNAPVVYNPNPITKDMNQAALYIATTLEGGVFIANDAGAGASKYGITQKSHPGEDIANMTPERAAQIYAKNYWVAAGIDKLPEGIRFQAFAVAVNMGNGAVAAIAAQAGGDPLKFHQATIAKYHMIAKANPEKAKFLTGWINRANKTFQLATGADPGRYNFDAGLQVNPVFPGMPNPHDLSYRPGDVPTMDHGSIFSPNWFKSAMGEQTKRTDAAMDGFLSYRPMGPGQEMMDQVSSEAYFNQLSKEKTVSNSTAKGDAARVRKMETVLAGVNASMQTNRYLQALDLPDNVLNAPPETEANNFDAMLGPAQGQPMRWGQGIGLNIRHALTSVGVQRWLSSYEEMEGAIDIEQGYGKALTTAQRNQAIASFLEANPNADQGQIERLQSAGNVRQLTYDMTQIRQRISDDKWMAEQGFGFQIGTALVGGLLDPTTLLAGVGIAKGVLVAAQTAQKVAVATAAVGDDAARISNAVRATLSTKRGQVAAATAAGVVEGVVETAVQDAVDPFNKAYTVVDFAIGAAIGGGLGGTITWGALGFNGVMSKVAANLQESTARQAIRDTAIQRQSLEMEADKAGITDPAARADFVNARLNDQMAGSIQNAVNSAGYNRSTTNRERLASNEIEQEQMVLTTRSGRDATVATLNKESAVIRKAADGVSKSFEKLGEVPELTDNLNQLRKNADEIDELTTEIGGEQILSEGRVQAITDRIAQMREDNVQRVQTLKGMRSGVKDKIKAADKDLAHVDKLVKEDGFNFQNLRVNKEVKQDIADAVEEMGEAPASVNREKLKDKLGEKPSEFELAAVAYHQAMEVSSPKIDKMKSSIEKWFNKNGIDINDAVNFAKTVQSGSRRERDLSRLDNLNTNHRKRLQDKAGNFDEQSKKAWVERQVLEDTIDDINLDSMFMESSVLGHENMSATELKAIDDGLKNRLDDLRDERAVISNRVSRLEEEIARKTGDPEANANKLYDLIDTLETLDNRIVYEKEAFSEWKRDKIQRLQAKEMEAGPIHSPNLRENAELQDIIMDGEMRDIDVTDRQVEVSRRGVTGRIGKSLGDRLMSSKNKVARMLAVNLAELMRGNNPDASNGAFIQAMLQNSFMGNTSKHFQIAKDLVGRHYGIANPWKRAEFTAKRLNELRNKRALGETVENEKDYYAFRALDQEVTQQFAREKMAMVEAGIPGAETLDPSTHMPRVVDGKKLTEMFEKYGDEFAKKLQGNIHDQMMGLTSPGGQLEGMGTAEVWALSHRYVDIMRGKANNLESSFASTNGVDGRDMLFEVINDPKLENVSAKSIALVNNRLNQTGVLKSKLELDITKGMEMSDGTSVKLSDILMDNTADLLARSSKATAGRVALAKYGIRSHRDAQLHLKAMTLGDNPATKEEVADAATLFSEYLGYRMEGAWPTARQGSRNAASLTRLVLLGKAGVTQLMEFATMVNTHGVFRTIHALGTGIQSHRRSLHAVKNGYVAQDAGSLLDAALGGQAYNVYKSGMDWVQLTGYGSMDGTSKIDKIFRWAENSMGIMSGLRTVTAFQRKMSMDAIARDMKDAFDGGKISKSLKEAGFTQKHVDALRKDPSVMKGGEDGMTMDLRNASDMKNAGEIQAIAMRINNRAVTNGLIGSQYSAMEGDWGVILGGLRRFSMIAKDKHYHRTLEQRGVSGTVMASLVSAIPIVGVLYLRAMYNTVGMGDQEREEYLEKYANPVALMRGAVAYNAYLGFSGDGLDVLEAVATPVVSHMNKDREKDDKIVIPGTSMGNRQGSSGPVAAIPLASATNSVWRGITSGDAHKTLSSLPFFNWLPVKPLVDMLLRDNEEEETYSPYR